MTKAKTVRLSSNAVAVKKSAAVPAVIEAETKAFKAFNKFVEKLDELVDYHEELQKTARRVRYGNEPDDIPADGDLIDEEWVREDIETCREGFRRFNRDGDDDPRYDDEGSLTFQHASVRLGMLISSFANSKPGSPEIFARMLAHHVLWLEPTACELESTCRELIDRGKPFAPEIPEVLSQLRSEQSKWSRRRHALDQVDALRREIIAAIPQAKAEAEAAAREEAARKLVEARKQAERVRAKAAIAYSEAKRECVRMYVESFRRPIVVLKANLWRRDSSEAEFVEFARGCLEVARELRRTPLVMSVGDEWTSKYLRFRRVLLAGLGNFIVDLDRMTMLDRFRVTKVRYVVRRMTAIRAKEVSTLVFRRGHQ